MSHCAYRPSVTNELKFSEQEIKQKKRGRVGRTGTVQQWKCVQNILGNVKPAECFLWLNFRIYVHGSKLLARQRNVYHLHSTASTFCGGDDDDGLIPVSEEADDMEAPVCDTEYTEQHVSTSLSKISSHQNEGFHDGYWVL